MTALTDPAERQPKGDHNRRLSLGLDPEEFAAFAGITVEELRDYENTWPDHSFSPMIAQRVGEALERLEAELPNSEPAGIRQIRGEGSEGSADLSAQADAAFDQLVRDTAYYMWESEGRPEGRDQEYWYRARELCSGNRALDNGFDEALDDDELADRAVEVSRKVGLQRQFQRKPGETVSGGFNQKR